MQKNKNLFSTANISYIAILVAMTIVCSRFLSVYITSFIKISTGFIPIAVGGYLMGPIAALIIAALADIIGANLFPVGAYFVGYTISSSLSGFIYGYFLYKNNPKPQLAKLEGKKFLSLDVALIIRCLIACSLVALFSNIILNTVWSTIFFNKAILAILPARLTSNIIQLPFRIVILTIFIGAISKIPYSLFRPDKNDKKAE